MKVFKYLNISTQQPPTMYMHGNNSLYIEHFEHINSFESEKIAIKLHTMDMVIEGKQLYIEYLSKHDIKISGHIKKILYISHGGDDH